MKLFIKPALQWANPVGQVNPMSVFALSSISTFFKDDCTGSIQSIFISRLLLNLRAADDDQGTQAYISNLVFRDSLAQVAKRPTLSCQESQSSAMMTESTHITTSQSTSNTAKLPGRAESYHVSFSESEPSDIQEVRISRLHFE